MGSKVSNRVANTFVYQKYRITRQILKSPVINIELFGDELAHECHGLFVASHRLLPWVEAKYFGAALHPLDQQEGPIAVPKYARRRINRSRKMGQTFRRINAADHIEDILRVNSSSAVRQNAVLESHYLDEAVVAEAARREGPSFAVFSAEDELIAYTHAPVLGDAFIFSYILGHSDYLDSGVMFRLVSETNDWMNMHRIENGYPKWACYDMFFGGGEGLRQFKYRCGFQPYRVNWLWNESKP